MRKYYVYIYEVAGLPIYVGKGFGYRDTRHIKDHCALNKLDWFHNKLRKMLRLGQEFKIFRLFENLLESEAFAWEIGLIAYFGRRNNKTGILLNLTNGGEGTSGRIVSEQERIKCSQRISALNSDPEFTARKAERMRLLHTDPEFRAATAKRLQAVRTNPKWLAEQAERGREMMLALHANPEFAKKKSDWMYELNSQPEFAATHAERGSKYARMQHINNQVAAFGQLWYQVDLAKKFGINYAAFKKRIKREIAPFWACMYSPGLSRKYPAYCKPKHISRIFGERPNAEAFDYMYANCEGDWDD
jgi:hypothetical protein